MLPARSALRICPLSVSHLYTIVKGGIAAALGTTPAYLTGATDKKTLPTGAPSGEEDPLDAQLRELLSHADDDLKQAMIAFLERFQKK